MSLSPAVTLTPLPIHQWDDLASLRLAFGGCQPIPMAQRYPGGDAQAAPSGEVRVGWAEGSLSILAELQGKNISTRATRLNDFLWLLGECFEIFLKFADNDRYLEFHIAPNNCVLQLVFPSCSYWQDKLALPHETFMDEFMLKKPAFVSRAWENGKDGWTAFAKIDLKILRPALSTLEGQELNFLFGRYHYPQPGGKPSLSCSSVLRKLDFHRQEDWGTLKCSSVQS